MERTLNSYLGNGDVIFASFDIHDNCHPVSSVEDLLKYSESSNFCFIQAMDVDTTNSKTAKIHYTAHQFWSKKVLQPC